MKTREKMLELLARAGLDDKEVLERTHPKRVRLALGRDDVLIKEFVVWLCDGDPGRAYARTPSLRPLLSGLYPGLKKIWEKLGEGDDEAG